MKSGLNLPETLGYGALFAASLTAALAHSPLWPHIPDATALLPPGYAALIAALPFAPNTGLALLVLGTLTYACLFLLRHAVVGLAGLAALVLAFAAYPYGHIRWHRIFIRLPIDDEPPGVAAWIFALLPVLLLLVAPVVLQVRTLLEQYRTKQVEPAERTAVRGHLARAALTTAGLATAFTVAMALLLFVVVPDLATGNRILVRNSVLVMLLIAVLLVAAIGTGTGAFRTTRAPQAANEDRPASSTAPGSPPAEP